MNKVRREEIRYWFLELLDSDSVTVKVATKNKVPNVKITISTTNEHLMPKAIERV